MKPVGFVLLRQNDSHVSIQKRSAIMKTLLLTLSLLTCVAFDSRAAEKAALSKPNIIFFLIDDWGWTDAGCCGSKFYETPNIDRLAREGMRFTQGYSACTVCSPTRASLKHKSSSNTGIHRKTSHPPCERNQRTA